MTTTEAIYDTLKEKGITPFSSGSGGMIWMAHNCDECVRSWCARHPSEQPPPFDETAKLAEKGAECWGAFAIGVGFVSGRIPLEVAEWIGAEIDLERNYASMPEQCRHFSDDDRDSPDYTPPPRDPNQTLIPFLCTELFGITDPDILVFDRAIIHREDLVPA